MENSRWLRGSVHNGSHRWWDFSVRQRLPKCTRGEFQKLNRKKKRIPLIYSWLEMTTSVSQGVRHRLKGSVNAVRIRAPQIGGELFFFVPLSSPLSVFIILSRLFCSPPGTVVWFKESTQTIFDLDSSIVSPVPLVIMLLLINKSWQGLGLHKWELFFRGKDLLYFLPYFLINISSVLSSWYILTIGIQTIDKLTDKLEAHSV